MSTTNLKATVVKPKTEPTYRIVRFTAENVKRLKAVSITPDGAIVQITGRNAQGKSSCLDAIAMAMGGKNLQPIRPIRDGAEKASVVVDLGDLVVERTWTAPDKTSLTVRSKDGAKFPSPQSVLDKLTGSLCFDPLAFSRMSAKEQVSTLKNVAGLDFSDLEKEREAIFNERTMINRDLKAAEAQLGGIAVVDAPDEEVSAADFANKYAEATAIARRKDDLSRGIDDAARGIAECNRLIAEAEEAIKRARIDLERLVASEREMIQQREAIVVPDTAAISEQLKNAEGINARVRQKKQRAEKSARVNTLRQDSETYTTRLNEIDAEKQTRLSEAPIPVPGLSFTEAGITFNGIPFEQASAAEQLRVSVAMGFALNPRLKIMLIRDGSLLDSDSLKMLTEMAERADGQVWLETVAGDEPVGVVIEDGMVKEVVSA